MIGGIDEAGRGPVFGPLVVAGVSGLDQETFRTLGVRDSKVLSDRQRRELAAEIHRVARRVETIRISADDIDQRRRDETLNEIEVTAFAYVARRLGAQEVFVDAADVDESRFSREIFRHLGTDAGVEKVVAEHKADARYPVVSAASIIAKVRRDQEVARMALPLEKKLGLPFGSGYPHDAATIRFMETYLQRFGTLPAGTRRSWDTARAIEARYRTPRLERFATPQPGGPPVGSP